MGDRLQVGAGRLHVPRPGAGPARLPHPPRRAAAWSSRRPRRASPDPRPRLRSSGATASSPSPSRPQGSRTSYSVIASLHTGRSETDVHLRSRPTRRRQDPAASATRGPAARRAASSSSLGRVSLLTDISSESVAAILPLYLTAVVGLTPVAYGLIDGLYQGVSALVRLGGGWLADAADRPKWVAFLGYGVSAVARVFLLFATGRRRHRRRRHRRPHRQGHPHRAARRDDQHLHARPSTSAGPSACTACSTPSARRSDR